MNKRYLASAVVAVVTAAAAVAVGLSSLPQGDAPAPAAPISSHGHHAAAAGPAPTGGPGGTVVVHAADQLRATLTKLVPTFEEAFPGVRVAVEWGAGAEHAGHIAAGMPVDVFVSADASATGRVAGGHARGDPSVVARNPIVIAVAEASAVTGVTDLPRAKVALCADSAPCGPAGRAALDAAAVSVRPASVAPDAAAALAQVRAGTADAALVHRTDVVAAGGGLRALDFTQALLLADEFTAIRVTTGANPVGADAFVAFLGSALARHVFADTGLSPT